jgi:alginate O-acetyltransferase complex protein AlgI
MSFVSIAFALLFTAAFLLRLTIGRTKKETPYLAALLFLSLVFYGWHVPSYLLILLTSTCVDFVAGRQISRTDLAAARRRAWLVGSLTVNLGLLGFFKYTNFLVGEVEDALIALGAGTSALGAIHVGLPIGISFYTFQSMSYSIDVYRGVQRPEPAFWRFLLFVSFFPQLVAGPIVRSRDFLYQIARRRKVHFPVCAWGFYLLVRGYFLKLCVADNIGPLVDERWDSAVTGQLGSLGALTVAWLFACQIFCDFAGYSSIARGLAYLLGFRLPVNFDAPYIAGSFSGFWRRWHITLSQWLRDYLYIPLGGNRGTRVRTMINLWIVMLLGGLWHGAANHFVVWGALHGAALIAERALGLRDVERSGSRGLRFAWFCVVQATVLVAWIFFRAGSAGEAVAFLRAILSCDAGLPHPLLSTLAVLYTLPVVLLHVRKAAEEGLGWRPGVHERIWVTAFMLLFILTGSGRGSEFIYFQF